MNTIDVKNDVSFFSLCNVLLLLLLLHVCVRLNLWQNSKTSFCMVKIFLYITLSCHKPYHDFRYFFAFRGLFFHIFIFFVCYTLKANKSQCIHDEFSYFSSIFSISFYAFVDFSKQLLEERKKNNNRISFLHLVEINQVCKMFLLKNGEITNQTLDTQCCKSIQILRYTEESTGKQRLQ